MPTPQDTFESYIGTLPVSQDVKRSTFDAMYGAKSWDDIKSSLSKLPLAQEQRKALWDIAVSQAGTASDAPKEQAQVPGVGSERRVIERAVDAAKEFGGSAYRSALSFVDKPAWDIATLLGYKPTEQEQTAYNAMIAAPQTTAGKIGAFAPLTAGALLGVAEVGVLPTLAGLATGYVGGKVSRKAADIALPGDMDPAKREAAMSLAEFGGMTVGGMAGTQATPRVVSNVRQRAAGATLGGIKGYKLGGYPAGVAGSVVGAISPETAANASKASILESLTRVASGGKEPTPTAVARGPKPTPTVFEQRNASINAGAQAATEAKSLELVMPEEATNYKKTLEKARDAHVANGEDVPQLVAEQLTRVSQQLAKPRLEKAVVAMQEKLNAYGPDGLAGRVELMPDHLVKRDYKATQKTLDAYIEAGEQPPTNVVELFDRLRERVIVTNKAVSAEAYDVATAALVDAAAQGPQAYAKVLQSLPKQTRALLQNVDAELLNTLQSRAKNAGGKLGKPADDPWFTLMNDVMGEWARPESVEVPVESPGGSATWPTNVDVVRKPGAAVSIDVSPENRGGALTRPQASPSLEQSIADAIQAAGRPESVSVPPSSPSGSATIPSGLDVVRVPGAAVSVPAQAKAPASGGATTPAAATAPSGASATTPTAASARVNSASARAARRGGSELGYSTELPRQHNAQTLATAARMLQLAHDITAVRAANHKAFVKGTPEYAMKDSALDASLAEFERLAMLFAGRGKLSPFASERQGIPNVTTVNGWISNATELTPKMKKMLGVQAAQKD